MPTQIILLEKVPNVGELGDVVKVKQGYARNFLVPTGRATMATVPNIAKFEAQRHELEARANQELAAAQERAAKLENFKLEHTFPRLGKRTLLLNARRLDGPGDPLILLAIEDVTDAPVFRQQPGRKARK